MVSVIFPAAGQGKRMGAGINKVFMDLAGVPILVRTLLKFSGCPEVDELIVAVAEEEVAFTEKMLRRIPGLKPWKVVMGGSERQYSIWNAILVSSSYRDDDIILVHDAARPLVSMETIEKTIAVAREKGGAIAAVPAKNTIKLCNAEKIVVETPDRKFLWEVQTPQGFRRDILIKANEQAMAEDFLGTDDASLVERAGYPVHIVESDYRNIKVTTPEDLLVGRAFLMDSWEEESLKRKLGQVLGSFIDDIQKNFPRRKKQEDEK